MVDHFAWAQGYRDRAAKCQLSAKNTSSTEFGECYRLLEKYYLMLANLEEDFGRRQVACPHAAGFTLKEAKMKFPFPKKADKPTVSRRQPGEEPSSLRENEMRAERRPPRSR